MHVIVPDHHGHPSYGMMNQYNATQHHHLAGNLDLPAVAASSQYNNNIYMNHPPSGTHVFPVPLTHGPHDQFQFSPNHGINEFHVDGYNNHFVDGAYKRKNAEGIPGNFQYCYAPAGPSYAAPRPLDSDLNLMEGGSGAVGIGESGLPHNTSHMIQGNHLGQPFQIPANPWLTQHFSNSGGEIGTLAWNQPPALPYIHGSINGGCLETPNMSIQGYQVTAGNRNTYIRPPSIPLHHPPPLPPSMHAIRGHNIEFHPQASSSSSSSRRIPANISNFQDGRFVGTAQQSGLRIYRPHRRDLMLEAAQRQTILPQLRVLPEDGVAILEFSGYHEGGEATDHHRDMRLDIDHMSYEELLELGEHIGNVGTGLSEESIINHLKRKTFITCSNLENTSGEDQELEFCVVCQNEYKDQEKMGILDCEHEFHEECIKKWLIEKNICPICKSPALNTDRKK
jgi:hypothetical protein